MLWYQSTKNFLLQTISGAFQTCVKTPYSWWQPENCTPCVHLMFTGRLTKEYRVLVVNFVTLRDIFNHTTRCTYVHLCTGLHTEFGAWGGGGGGGQIELPKILWGNVIRECIGV